MGKVKVEPQQSKNTTHHFSHPHPLELITNQNFASSSSQLCSGCKIQAIGSIYTCKSCNFFLHIECSQMPQQITHPFDKEHHFTLLPKPIYPEGNFNCDACGENGDGFSYHCKTCGTDLHILCAVFPLCVTHWSHHHQLDLKFSPPYPDKSFCCDICKNVGNNHWLYRCQTCGFDAHLNCTKLQAPPDHTHIHHNPTTSRSAPQQQQHFTGINHMNQGIDSGPAVPQFWSRQNNEMAAQEILRKQSEDQQKLIQEMFTAATARQNQLIQQHMAATSRQNQDIYQQIMAASARQNQEINQQLTQALMNNASAGGVPMPNLYQNMMGGLNNAGGVNVLQAFSGGGGGGGIGGGSGGMELLQSLMGGGSGGIGGGGGGMELLQSLMGSGSGGIGGGSGGMELLQSLMGGSSGGTGGLDLTALFGSLNF